MAGEKLDNVWPLIKFYFMVDWGDQTGLGFQEVTGLSTEAQVVEYRHSNNPLFSTIKMPGIKKFGNITFKKGMFKGDSVFWTAFSQINMNTVKRETVVIKLLDEGGEPVMTWTLNNAFPCKITGTDMKSDSNEVAIESMEVAYEFLTFSAN